MENVLVTGATGFIGQSLVARLLREQFTVHALTRDAIAARQKLPAEVRVLSWNSPNKEVLVLPEEISAVIHLAGESLAHWPWNQKQKERLWNSRIQPTNVLVEAMGRMDRKPSVLISASGMGFYGDSGDELVRIDDPPGKDFLGKMAAAWEAEALKAQDLGIRVVIPRFGMVLASNGGALPKMAFPAQLGLSAVLGSGKQYWPWIHLDDAVELLFQSIVRESFSGPVQAIAGKPLTQGEFTQVLASKFQKPTLFRIPEFGLRLGLGEMADLFLHGQKAESDLAVFTPRHASLKAALSQIFP